MKQVTQIKQSSLLKMKNDQVSTILLGICPPDPRATRGGAQSTVYNNFIDILPS